MQISVQMYKITNKIQKSNLNFNVLRSHYNIRGTGQLRIPRFSTEKGRYRLSVQGPIIYNGLNEEIKQATCTHKFRKKLKLHMLNNISEFIV